MGFSPNWDALLPAPASYETTVDSKSTKADLTEALKEREAVISTLKEQQTALFIIAGLLAAFCVM